VLKASDVPLSLLAVRAFVRAAADGCAAAKPKYDILSQRRLTCAYDRDKEA
jgi:hypothetical protein